MLNCAKRTMSWLARISRCAFFRWVVFVKIYVTWWPRNMVLKPFRVRLEEVKKWWHYFLWIRLMHWLRCYCPSMLLLAKRLNSVIQQQRAIMQNSTSQTVDLRKIHSSDINNVLIFAVAVIVWAFHNFPQITIKIGNVCHIFHIIDSLVPALCCLCKNG